MIIKAINNLVHSHKFFILFFTIDLCEGFCHNEGTCHKDKKGQPFCECSGSFIGKQCMEKSDFAYIAGGIAAGVFFIIVLVLLIWMICHR